MIKIMCRNKEREAKLVELIHGEFIGRIFVSFPIKGKTRKDRRSGLYQVISSSAVRS